MPTVSTVIPVYNDADTLPRAIDSVLNQSHQIKEIIIVDDCSTDSPEKVVNQYDDDRITFISHETNRGGGAARNTGIEAASSEFIAFLDADDEWKSTKIEKQLTELQSRSDEWVAVHCRVENDRSALNDIGDKLATVVGARDADPATEGDSVIINEILRMNWHMSTSSLLVKRETVETVDGFDERFQRHQDWEFLIRVVKHGKLAFVDEPLVIKHGTGRPSAAVHEDAKRLFLNKFDEEIAALESDGEEITHRHELHLARLYLEDGEFGTGFEKAEISTPTDVLSVAWSLSLGVHSKVRSVLS
ncbi:glycosyltransferase [Halorubrum terrestre]|uniref:Glycosyltransferase n=1 Tax=Halorubrum distributum TaxID=29283 RepID=A0A6B1I9H9_9EURY|nr:glycosyltransferase [Halorubrum terrestre]MYL15293.1 glycosyltransferase [Halorubrum terrestre]